MKRTNYLDIARNDYLYLTETLQDKEGHFNHQAIDAQQIVEKYLKGMLEIYPPEDIQEIGLLLRSHNLRRIALVLQETLPAIKLDITEMSFLKDFYFDARYPGDDYITVTKEMRDKALSIMNDVRQQVETLLGSAER